MRPEKLLSMANQIAGFFRSYPEEEAVSGIHRHVTTFWTPAMIVTLRQHLQQGGTGADLLVEQALCRRPDVESPVHNVASPAREAGPMASDAG